MVLNYDYWPVSLQEVVWDRSKIDLPCSMLSENANTSWKRSNLLVAFPHKESRKPIAREGFWRLLFLQVAKNAWTTALIAAWDNRRIQDKIDKSHRNTDVYTEMAKAVKKKGFSLTWLEAALKKCARETSKSCFCETRIYTSSSQPRIQQSTAVMKDFLAFLELSF